MKIGIDASRAFLKQRTGIEEYSYQVIKHLCKELQKEEVFLYVRRKQKIDFKLPKNWKMKTVKFPYLWTQLGLSLELLFHPVDVLFVPAHVIPIIHPKNTIVTMHGLEYEFFPEGYSFWERLYMRASIKMSCRWAKKIIAVSKNTKKDLLELYKVPEKKIKVVYEGVDLVQSSKLKVQSCSSKLKIDKPYLLFIGRLEKRKNIDGILDAYKILKEKYEIPHALVLAGASGYGYEIIKLKIKNYLKIQNSKLKIIEPGYIDETLKWQLMSNADAFLFPTFYEGFGLPILEAQSLGVPVITSNVSSLPEVGGESVFYADPHEPEIIADTIFRLISDQNVKDDIIKKGNENVKRFSWEKCSDEIAKLLMNYDKR
jgi:glycosyltransferase involved in cell wall biosynthesis